MSYLVYQFKGAVRWGKTTTCFHFSCKMLKEADEQSNKPSEEYTRIWDSVIDYRIDDFA